MRVLSFFAVALLLVSSAVASDAASEDTKVPPTELVIEVLEQPENCNEKSAAGDTISVHYTGTLFSNGNKFDSSHDRGQPFDVILGVGQVIPGWDEGLKGMCVKEKRRLTIPSNKAYGSRGFGNIIPPHSALVFEVELLGLTSASKREEL